MKLTKKQKGYLAVLAVALVAFLADRFIFLPASAGADAVEQDDAQTLFARTDSGGAARPPRATAAASASLVSPYRVDLLGERLRGVAAERRVKLSAGVRDAFVPSAAWVARPEVGAHDMASEAARAFRDRHKLKAIFLGPSGKTAVIGNWQMREGQRLGSFTLVEIGTRSVTLASGAQRIELVLDQETSINAE